MLLFLLLLLLPRCSSASERGSHHPSVGPKHLVPEMTLDCRRHLLLSPLLPPTIAVDAAAGAACSIVNNVPTEIRCEPAPS